MSRVREFGGDLVHDLRSRGLLPLVLVLAAAIVAVPLAIKAMSGSDGAPAAGQPGAVAIEPAPEGQAAVLAYSPGLRNQRRLDGSAGDPFRQQYPAISAEAPGGGASAVGSGGPISPSSGTSGGTGGSGGGGSGGGGGGGDVVFVSYQTDLLVGEEGGQLARRNNVAEFTLLPSEDVAAAVFLGATADGKQAIFSVSRSVTSVSGAGTCYPEPDACELLGLTVGQGASLSYEGQSYRVEVARIKRVES